MDDASSSQDRLVLIGSSNDGGDHVVLAPSANKSTIFPTSSSSPVLGGGPLPCYLSTAPIIRFHNNNLHRHHRSSFVNINSKKRRQLVIASPSSPSSVHLNTKHQRMAIHALLAVCALLLTAIVVFLLLSIFFCKNNNDNYDESTNKSQFGFIWLPQRSLLPSICFKTSDCSRQLLLRTDGDDDHKKPSKSNTNKPSVAVLIVATGHYYKQYVKNLLLSARRHFCKTCNVTYFIFTDYAETDRVLPRTDWLDVIHLHQVQLGWPLDSLMRFSIYRHFYDTFKGFDYVVSMDADLLFVDDVERELLGDVVGVLHAGFFSSMRGSYEEANVNSTAYVRPLEGSHYFSGSLWAASSGNFLKIINHCSKAVEADLASGIIAVYYDESHLNRFFIDREPSTLLSPAYNYPSDWRLDASIGDRLKIVTLNNKNNKNKSASSRSTVRRKKWITDN